MAEIRHVTPRFAVAPQIEAADFAAIAAAGFKSVINNRPDGETPGQLSDADAKRAAEAAGLAYLAIPFAGNPQMSDVDAMERFLAAAPGPTLAYCRTGTRSIKAWALAQAKSKARGTDEIIGLANAAGYDLAPLKPAMEQLAKA